MKLAGEIPGAKPTWLDDLGHYPMLEAPNRRADALVDSRLTRRSSRATLLVRGHRTRVS